MELALLVLAAITCGAWCLFTLDLLAAQGAMISLEGPPPPESDDLFSTSPPGPGTRLPLVSVVVPARDEADHVEETIESILALDYPRLEVVAVDDRSTDGTGEILDRLASAEPRLRALHVETLPDGWLGKNHALQTGARAARGDFFLFTDADVRFAPSALSRAMRHVLADDLDHLTAACDVDTSSPALELFVATFALFFNGYFRPWHVNNPKRKNAVGFGAFNLVRKTAWERAGTHEAIALAADDDVRLGRILRGSGSRQRFVLAGREVHVEWYPDLPSAIRGLEKNTMAAVDYSFGLIVAAAFAQIVFTAWPFVAPWVTAGPTRLLYLGAVAAIVTSHLTLMRPTSLRAWTALALPIGVVLVVFTLLRSAWLARWRGGVYWRGTFHSLSDLDRH